MGKYCPKCRNNFSDSFDECVYCGTTLQIGTITKPNTYEDILSMSDEEILTKYQSYKSSIDEQLGYCMPNDEFINGLKESRREQLSNISSKNRLKDTPPISTEPHCPTCQSTDIQKIGGLERAGSVAVFGLFSKKINKSFKCKNCGYTW